MATNKNDEVKNERVDVFVPRDGGDANLFVSVNGVNYVLPKGKTSSVPKHVAEEIKRAWKAADAYENKKSAMIEASRE